MEEEQALPNLGEDRPPVPHVEGENLFQNLLAAASTNTAEVVEDHPHPNMEEEQPLHDNDKAEEGQSSFNNVMGEELQLPSESSSAGANAAGESEQDYLFTKSPSSGTGGSDYEVDDEDEEEFPEFQAPTSESAMDVESSNGMLGADGHGDGTLEAEQSSEMNAESQDGSSQDNPGGSQHESYDANRNEQYDPYAESYAYEGEGHDKWEGLEDSAGTAQPFKIFVSNLPPGLPSSELKELFEKYGQVDECEIFAKNYAFVHMASPESGLQALNELHGLDIRGCKINVKRSVQTRDTYCNSLLPTNAVKEPLVLEVGTYKIYIGGLFEDVTKEYIQTLLEENECGRAVEIEIFRNNSAFVHMETEEGGKMAMEKLNGKVITDPVSESDRPLRVMDSTNPRGPSIAMMKLKVKNISTLMSAAELRSLFFPYGLVLGVQIIPKLYCEFGGTRHAVVLLEQYGNIRSAIKELSGKEVHGIKLSVEACFDDKKSTTSQQRQNRSNPFNQDDSEWREVHNPPIPYHPPRGFAPRMRVRPIPMPSQADFQRFPMGNRGRPLLGQAPIMHQHFGGPPRHLFQPPRRYNEDAYGYDEVLNAGFGGGYSNYESEEYNNGYRFNNESDRYIPPMKRSRDWNNSERSNNFEKQKQIGNRPNSQRSSSSRQNQFPHFPSPEEFPKPPSLMSVPLQQPTTKECDWSDDLQLSSLSENFSTGAPVSQEFASDETSTATTHAVPFDYSQINKRKNMRVIPMPSQADARNQRKFSSQKGKNLKTGKSKKGKPRRPGLGSTQQQKVFSNQAGGDNMSQDAINEPAAATLPEANEGVGVKNATASSSTHAPHYFQQNWSFKSKRPTGKPSVKQIKEAEEEQKRQYADYLKAKPWLYQAIPGTVKRVDK